MQITSTMVNTTSLKDGDIATCTQIFSSLDEKEKLDKKLPDLVAHVLNKFFDPKEKVEEKQEDLESLMTAVIDFFEDRKSDALLDSFAMCKSFLQSLISIVKNFEMKMRTFTTCHIFSATNHKCYELTLFVLLGKTLNLFKNTVFPFNYNDVLLSD